jgi:hypothetical protein
LTRKAFALYNFGATDLKVFALAFALAHEAQGFALDKVFHWRSTPIGVY